MIIHSLPWDQSTPLGYSLEICFCIYKADSYFLTYGSLLVLFTSICMHHQTFYEIFNHEAQKLHHSGTDRSVAEHLSKMIRFHISVKEWVIQFISFIILTMLVIEVRNEIEFCVWFSLKISCRPFSWFLYSAETYSGFILVVLTASMLLLACVVFQLDLVTIWLVNIFHSIRSI